MDLPGGLADVIRGTPAEPPARSIEPAAPLPGLLPCEGFASGRERVVDIISGPLQVRLAESAADIAAAQRLRYRIFYEIMGARPLPGMERLRRDFDGYDHLCDHLLVLDRSQGSGADAVVGTYRLIR